MPFTTPVTGDGDRQATASWRKSIEDGNSAKVITFAENDSLLCFFLPFCFLIPNKSIEIVN